MAGTRPNIRAWVHGGRVQKVALLHIDFDDTAEVLMLDKDDPQYRQRIKGVDVGELTNYAHVLMKYPKKPRKPIPKRNPPDKIQTFLPFGEGSFKQFIESKDIFGFDKDIQQEKKPEYNDYPIRRFNIEEMMEYLAGCKLPGKNPQIHQVNEIRWGDQIGAVRVKIGTTLQVEVDKLCSDLKGNPTWVTKKFYQINRAGYGTFEKNVAEELFGEVERIDKEEIDAPKKEYAELPNLVVGISNKLRTTAKEIFVYEGIRKVNDNNYIIKFGVRGHGVEARDHQRVIENLTDISFNKKTGKIRVINSNVKTNVGGHNWKLTPADQDWSFMPTQTKDEIIEVISTNMKWY